MATVSQENIGKQHEKITISLPKEDFMPQVEKAIKQYTKNANIPGFRKGMVPIGMIKKQYGQTIYTEEVLRIAGAKLEEHLVSTKAEIFARPIPAASQENIKFDINNPQDYVFEFEVGTRPHFNIPLLSGNETMPIHKIIVTDEMVKEEVDKLQYKSGEMKDADEVTSEDNVLNVVFEELDLSGQAVENGIKKDNSLLVKYFTPTMQKELMGKKNNDSVNVVLKDAFDEKVLPAIVKDLDLNPADEDAKNKSFSMLITKIGLVEKSILNKEMFEKIYPGKNIETEEDFINELKGEIQSYWNIQSRTKLHNEIFERLVHETDIDIPTEFLKRWMSVGGESYKSPEQVEQEFGGFQHQLRWQLISDKLIEDNKLQVTKDEMEAATRAQLMSYFAQMGSMPMADEDWIEPFVAKQLSDTKFADELHNRIVTDKLFAGIESMLNLQEKEISLEDFSNLPSSHHHHH